MAALQRASFVTNHHLILLRSGDCRFTVIKERSCYTSSHPICLLTTYIRAIKRGGSAVWRSFQIIHQRSGCLRPSRPITDPINRWATSTYQLPASPPPLFDLTGKLSQLPCHLVGILWHFQCAIIGL